MGAYASFGLKRPMFTDEGTDMEGWTGNPLYEDREMDGGDRENLEHRGRGGRHERAGRGGWSTAGEMQG
jgi:hypothetical protein